MTPGALELRPRRIAAAVRRARGRTSSLPRASAGRPDDARHRSTRHRSWRGHEVVMTAIDHRHHVIDRRST